MSPELLEAIAHADQRRRETGQAYVVTGQGHVWFDGTAEARRLNRVNAAECGGLIYRTEGRAC